MASDTPETIIQETIIPQKRRRGRPAMMKRTVGRPPKYPEWERLPSPGRAARTRILAERTKKSVSEAREHNSTISVEDRETFYLAGMNAIAQKIWELARLKHPEVHELRTYLELYLKHRELEIKKHKTDLMLRHLELLEQKHKALEALAKDSGIPDPHFFARFREIMLLPNSNGHSQTEAPITIENGFPA